MSMPARESWPHAGSRLKRPGTLTSQVVAYIRDAVVRGELEPDQPLPEVRLAQELETARVTVRVALRALADLGLVEIIPHKGAFVSSLTPRKAWEIFSLRAILESYGARLALERGPLSAAALGELELKLERISQASDQDDPSELIEAVAAFHLWIAEQSGHELLVSQLEDLQPQIRRLIFYTKLFQSDPLSEVESHQQVVAALRTGKGAVAEKVIFDHHKASGERLVQRMTELEAQRAQRAP